MLVRWVRPCGNGAVLLVAMVYLAWGGASAACLGSFHLGRMWQGKAAFGAGMVPLLYVYLTDWAERRSRRTLLLVAAAGIAGAGLSSAAVYVVPFITAAVVVPLLLARQFRGALGAMLATAYPLGAGLIVAVLAPITHLPNVKMTAPAMWGWVLLTGTFGVIGGIAVWTAPRLARRGVPALITAGIAGVTTVLMVPGVLSRVADATGAGPVLYRTLWVVPGPVLVGLIVSVPVPPLAPRLRAAGRWLSPVPTLALCGVLIGFGIPLWSHQSGSTTIAAHPSWKYDPASLRMARRVLQADHHPGYLLTPWKVMQAVPLLTSRVLVVMPRGFYLRLHVLAVSAQFEADRWVLTRLADGARPLPTQASVQAAVTRIGLGYACLPAADTPAVSMLEAVGFTAAAQIGSYQCLQSSR